MWPWSPSRGAQIPRRSLSLAMVVVVVVFLSASVYTQRLLTGDVEALDIASNSAPSIAELSDARAELRTLGDDAEKVVSARDEPATTDAQRQYAASRRRMSAALADYERLPNYAGERETYESVLTRLAALDREVAAASATHAADERAERLRIHRVVDDLDSAIARTSELNRAFLRTASQRILVREQRRNLYAFVLDAIGVLAALAATLLVMRTVERYVAALQRRTKELEYLAIQVSHEIANPLTPIQVALRLEDEISDEHRKATLARASRSLERIRASIDRLSGFAKAGIAPTEAQPRTAVAPAVQEAARARDLAVLMAPELYVRCSEPILREVVGGLIDGCLPPSGEPPVAIEVAAGPRAVRIAAVCEAADPCGDPFEPQLRDPGSGLPGLDLRLATVRRRVESCGGRTHVRYEGRKRRCTIELPRA